MNFPRLVYKAADNHVLAEDQGQYDALIKDGWFGSVPEALAKTKAQPAKATAPTAKEAPPTRAELEAKAKELGIKFTKNTADADLLQLITDKLAA